MTTPAQSRRIKLIFNPMANHHQAGQAVADLRSQFDEQGGVDWIATEYPGHAARLAADAALEGYETVVAIGGDGTVHECINGLMKIAAEHRPRLGIIPVGSGNDFANSAGVASNPADAVRRIVAGETMAVDVWKIADGSGREEYWNNTCGIGFDGQINMVTRSITFVHGFLMYLVSTIITIVRHYVAPHMQIWVDDELTFERQTLMLTLGNGPREGGGFITTPDSKLDDGLLDYCLVDRINRLQMLLLIPRVLNGAHGGHKNVTLGQCRSIKIVADRALAVHIDGELFAAPEQGISELTVTGFPAAVRVLV